jgi:hypothetical protein
MDWLSRWPPAHQRRTKQEQPIEAMDAAVAMKGISQAIA